MMAVKKGLTLVTGLLVVGLVGMLGVNIFMRYFLGQPFSWSGEVGRLLLVWISFLGAALAAADRRHMAMDLLKTSLPDRARRVLDRLLSLGIAACLGVLLYQGISMTAYNASLESEQLQFSYAFFYSAIPVGLAFYLLFETVYLIGTLRAPDSADVPATGRQQTGREDAMDRPR